MKDKNQGKELEIKAALDYGNRIISTLREPFLVLDKKLRVISANEAFYNTFKAKKQDTIGQFFYDLDDKQWNVPELIKLLKEVLPKKKL
ncbi:hypothetical protein ACFL2G_00290 [Candidatus Omnitrophota bacterium]